MDAKSASARAAIKTKYIGPTNMRGSRIKAICQRGSVTIPYDHSMRDVELHIEAVKALMNKYELEWGNKWAVGGVDNDGYIFVPVCDKFNIVDL